MSDIARTIFSCYLYFLYLQIYWSFEYVKEFIRFVATGTVRVPLKKVRLGRILYSHKRDPEEISRREDFVTWDKGFAPFSILKSGNWALYTLDKRGAIFVELPKPLQEYTIDKYPFIFTPTHEEAKQTAELSLEAFIDFANDLEKDGKVPRTLLFTNTARCASTLFGSMLNHPGHSIVLGEPHVLTCMSVGYGEGYWDKEDLNQLLPAIVKSLRKDISPKYLFVIKTESMEVRLVPFFKSLVPEMMHVFMFRKKGLDSVERMCLRDPRMPVLNAIYNISPRVSTTLFGWLQAGEGPHFRVLKPRHMKEWSMLVYAAPYSYYMQNEDAFDFPVVWHHELISDAEQVLRPIFEKLSIPEECLPNALSCLNRDSQKGTFLSQDSIRDIHPTPMTPALESSLRLYVEHMKIPKEIVGF
ncbi:hypothetical protein Ddc_12658 [Ditylenchus destructor]|nr:hypothetical protein Ddc_12658 [Ditylenchus destructor]